MQRFDCWLPSWDEMDASIKDIAKKIKKDSFQPDIVIALSRGGFVPARIICDSMIIKDLVSIKVDHWGITATKDGKAHLRYPLEADLSGKKVLIVDDITDTGESMVIAKEYVEKLNPREIKTAAIFQIKTSKFVPDYFHKEIDWVWIIWPWNYSEDLVNITSKILKNNDCCSTAEIKDHLKIGFKINLSEQKINEIMTEMAETDIVKKDDVCWRLI